MEPTDVERRGKCRREIILIGYMHLAIVKDRRCGPGSRIHNIIAISEHDRIERALQGHVIIAVAENDGGEAVAAVNRNIGSGGGVANDDVAYPAQTKGC